MEDQSKKKCDVGLIGLGVMGRNFARNMADHGFSVAGFDRDREKIEALLSARTPGQDLQPGRTLTEFLGLLSRPRVVMLLVPAGNPVDAVIDELLPHLAAGDLIIDSGNSRFTDTDRRIQLVEGLGFFFMGMGMSGGESGARHGPSLMPGGNHAAYDIVGHLLEAVSARVGEEPCVAYLGPKSAGHYVKMVHNGIEYALMQLISETYDLMKRGLGLGADELHAVYARWNQEELDSYLMEITADIFLQKDTETQSLLLDLIRGEAKQKGTGEWTALEALELQVPVLNITTAVMMRDMSIFRGTGKKAGPPTRPGRPPEGEKDHIIHQIKNALYTAMIITYDQGLALLAKASTTYGYDLNLETVARVWRGGCIIRAALLEDIRSAYGKDPDLKNILLDDHLGRAVVVREADLRAVVRLAAESALPAPGMMTALSYLDAFRSDWLPANLLMAQRDYFGSHTYQRIDKEGTFHTEWEHH